LLAVSHFYVLFTFSKRMDRKHKSMVNLYLI
jgi:hypothetical protein